MQIDGEPYALCAMINTDNLRLGLNPNRTYSFYHTGLDAAEASSSQAVRFGFTEGLNLAVAGVGKNRGLLVSNQVITVSGVEFIFFRATAGTPVLLIKAGRLEGEMKHS